MRGVLGEGSKELLEILSKAHGEYEDSGCFMA